jgi:hypothetical protein
MRRRGAENWCTSLKVRRLSAFSESLWEFIHTKYGFRYYCLPREQVEYLRDGLVTVDSNSNLKCLHFEFVNFQDEAMSALVSGLRQNSTLQIVKFENCGVTDAQVS